MSAEPPLARLPRAALRDRESARRFAGAIGSELALLPVSPRAALILLLPGVPAVAALEAPTGYSVAHALLVGLLGVAGSGAAALAAGAAATRWGLRARAPWLVLLVVALLAGIVLGALRAASAQWVNADPQLGPRVLASVLECLAWIGGLAVTRAAFHWYRDRYTDLERVRVLLEESRDLERAGLDSQLERLADAVEEQLARPLALLRRQVATVRDPDADRERVSRALTRLSGPALHRLIAGLRNGDPMTGGGAPRAARRMLADVLRRPVAAPWLGFAVIVAGVGADIVRNAGWPIFAAGVAVGCLAAGALHGVERATSRWDARAAASVQWLALVALTAAVALAPHLDAVLADTLDTSTQVLPVLLFLPLVAVTSILTAGAAAALRAGDVLLHEQEAETVALRAASEESRRGAEEARRRTAELLHGAVQGHLAAAAMLLDLRPAGEGVSEDLVRETDRQLELAEDELGRLARPTRRVAGLTDVLAQIDRDWRGLLRIEVVVTPDAAAVIDADQELLRATAALLEDTATNAVRHGRARELRLTLALRSADGENAPQDTLVVIAEDDGSAPPASRTDGDGYATAAWCAEGGRWEIRRTGSGAVVTASRPVRALVG